MKKVSYYLVAAVAAALVVCFWGLHSCKGCGGPDDEKDSTNMELSELPLNITVYIDLSDRIVHPGQPSQIEKDTAMIGHVVNYFVEKTKQSENGLQESKNAIKILFYPAPTAGLMVKCADELVLDIPKIPEGTERLHKVMKAKETFQKNLEQIYQQAITDGNFIGCDIWGFFSYGKAKQQCVREGYRNIMFVLTDGYVYHKNNIVQKGDSSRFILPKVLNNPKAALEVVSQSGLENLEVAIMEIQPEDPKHLPKMKSMLENWLIDMGVKPENIIVEETGLPASTRVTVDNILK